MVGTAPRVSSVQTQEERDGPSGRHRAGRRGRPVTSSALAQTMVDARTLTEHLIDFDTFTAVRHQGRYVALCGTEVLAASMTTEERGHCRECFRRQVDRCT